MQTIGGSPFSRADAWAASARRRFAGMAALILVKKPAENWR
jgi:hypothetical protein